MHSTDQVPGRFAIRACTVAITLMFSVYAAYFAALEWLMHENFQTWAYDLGTFDQGIWLAGRQGEPFVTVRGLHLLGDHVRLFSYVLSPLYWIVDDVRALLVLHSLAIAAGVLFVYLLGCQALGRGRALVLALCASYLLNPAVQNLNIDHAHPDAFASTFILASLYFLRTGRNIAFGVAAALAMSCKEDVPFVYLVLGLLIAVRGGGAIASQRAGRWFGVLLSASSAAYLLLCTTVILPHFNHVGFFRHRSFSQFNAHFTDHQWLVSRLFTDGVAGYLWILGLPLAFTFVLAPLSLLPAVPALAANLLSDIHYMRSVLYHYATSIVPFLYLAAIDALQWMLAKTGRPRLVASLAAFAMLGGAVAANLQAARVPLTDLSRLRGLWYAYRNDPAIAAVHDLLAQVPSEAAVSADFTLVPHLSHRRRIYLFPNPFEMRNWGIDNRKPHDPAQIEYIIGRSSIWQERDEALVSALVANGEFVQIAGDERVALYRRVPPRLMSNSNACCDWDGDGAVTALDARRILQAIMDKKCPPNVCDINGDGAMTLEDARLAGRRARGQQVPLRCPPPLPAGGESPRSEQDRAAKP